ncbi:hypothetical protein DUNSADRAFT_7217 [Dunaliella salina]|uniref:Uncharacterized protein n=1 Tax=Dunaliella salina TaxID=3046 RepID=A0ABQ7GLS5_DUNSA|nr:hypothetical protein DUNSADRAFT_7217 [Dunaliella salina]|eukprot:KAF5835564.1 hypothetical protein DUNSADRAFT_7217 [Dunaliella salina]
MNAMIAGKAGNECSRFRSVSEPFDEPAFLAAVAKAFCGNDGVDDYGKCVVNPAVTLQQLAFVAAKICTLLRSKSAKDQNKEGDEGCEAEFGLMLSELGAWRRNHPNKDLTGVKLVDPLSTGL